VIIMIHFYLKRQNRIRAQQFAIQGGVASHAKVQEKDGEVVDTDHGMLDLVSPCRLGGLHGEEVQVVLMRVRTRLNRAD